MEMTEKKNDLKSMMVESMEKVKEMVDANNIVGEPITTPDGVTLIPISRLSYGFGCGGGDYGKNKEHSGAGCGAGVRVEQAENMKLLGEACGIAVGAAIAAVV
ncbi:MAG: hypothetical protein KHW98_08780 [Firmicutes bacterium]|nr:hypothetical protein [Bacillota bacterium]